MGMMSKTRTRQRTPFLELLPTWAICLMAVAVSLMGMLANGVVA